MFIHDAARPNFSIKLLKKISKSLKQNKAVVPIISSKDSIKYRIKKQIFNLDRKNSLLTQTPQAFRFKELYNLASKQKIRLMMKQLFLLKRTIKLNLLKEKIIIIKLHI